jgi:hypothetical protein
VRPIDGHSGDAESQDDENDDWRIFHDQGSQLSRDAVSHERSIARQVKFVLEKEDRANRPELNVAQKILGARPRASAEVTFDLMTVASRDRIAMSQAPTPTKRNMQ